MNDDYISLSLLQVATAAALILVNGLISVVLKLGLANRLAIAALRTVVQLLLIGLVLEWVFSLARWELVLALVVTMTVIAGISAVSRVSHTYVGIHLNSLLSVAVSSWLMTAFAVLLVVRQTNPWWDPQYLVPLLGMILGNSLNGVSLGLSTLGDDLVARRDRIETLLALGASRSEAARGLGSARHSYGHAANDQFHDDRGNRLFAGHDDGANTRGCSSLASRPVSNRDHVPDCFSHCLRNDGCGVAQLFSPVQLSTPISGRPFASKKLTLHQAKNSKRGTHQSRPPVELQGTNLRKRSSCRY